MIKGDILLVPFPFSDLTGSKTRPALILAVKDSDIIVAFISTQLHRKEEDDIYLKPNDDNGLKKDSFVRLTKVATLDKELALGRIGTINSETIRQVNSSLRKILQID